MSNLGKVPQAGKRERVKQVSISRNAGKLRVVPMTLWDGQHTLTATAALL
jgi:hypothetical protein